MLNVYCGYITKKDNFSYLESFKQIEEFDKLLKSRNYITKNVDIYTNSPYILNYLNLLIIRYDKNIENVVKVDYDKINAYFIINEENKKDLKVQNERLINTNDLSDCINWIYDEYNKIK